MLCRIADLVERDAEKLALLEALDAGKPIGMTRMHAVGLPSICVSDQLTAPLRSVPRCDWRLRLVGLTLFGRQHKVPRQQRLVVIGGLRERQRREQGFQITVRVNPVDLAGLQQRVQVGARVGAGHGAREQPVASSNDNLGVILPMSGKRWKSSTSGMHFMGAVSGGNTASTEQPVTWFTSRSNPA